MGKGRIWGEGLRALMEELRKRVLGEPDGGAGKGEHGGLMEGLWKSDSGG